MSSADNRRSYKMGLRFEGETRKERRLNEILAHKQLRELQEQSIELIRRSNAVDIAIHHLRAGEKWSGTNGAAILATKIGDRSNLGQHSFLLALNAAKGVIAREKKLRQFLQFLKENPRQQIEWLVFARTPYNEFRLSKYYKLHREYTRNLIYSARRILDPIIDPSLKLQSTLPVINQNEWIKCLDELVQLKTKEFALEISTRQKAFLNKLKLLQKHSSLVAFLLETWIMQFSELTRWKTLKGLANKLPDILGERKNLQLFSSLRSLVVFALSSNTNFEETVGQLMKTLNEQDLVSKPFVKKKLKLAPLSLVMGSKYVIQRPGSGEKMTELALETGEFKINFPKIKSRNRITATLRFHKKLQEYLTKGAVITLLNLHAGNAPAYKIIASIVMEGEASIFQSKKQVKELSKTLNFQSSESILGLDINRVGEHILVYSEGVELPNGLKKLCTRYKNLGQKIKEFQPCLIKSMEKYRTPKVIKQRGELKRIQERRAKILTTIHLFCSQLSAAVLLKGNFDYFALEDLDVHTRDTKGGLARAICGMADDPYLYRRSMDIASELLGKEIQPVYIDGRTSSIHFNCGGSLERSLQSWDFAACNKCLLLVNTHKNAAYNIRKKANDLLVPVRIPGTSLAK